MTTLVTISASVSLQKQGCTHESRPPLDFIPAHTWFALALDSPSLHFHALFLNFTPGQDQGSNPFSFNCSSSSCPPFLFHLTATMPNKIQTLHAMKYMLLTNYKPGNVYLASFPAQIHQTMGKQPLKKTHYLNRNPQLNP